MEESKLKEWNDKFNLCLGIEFSNPEYFKVHHILVITFMLQTGRYAETYLNEAVSLLNEFLLHPLETPTKFKIDTINAKFSSHKRSGRIVREEAGDVIESNQTILDVRTDTAEHYRKDVVAWAETIIQTIQKSPSR